MMQILSVASEAFPLIKTGGLADVVGALPAALSPHATTITTLLPGYPSVLALLKDAETVHTYTDLLGGKGAHSRLHLGPASPAGVGCAGAFFTRRRPIPGWRRQGLERQLANGSPRWAVRAPILRWAGRRGPV